MYVSLGQWLSSDYIPDIFDIEYWLLPIHLLYLLYILALC